MRISIIVTFILITCLHMLWASPGKAQSMSTERVTLGLKRGSLKDVIRKVEQQTALRFYYRNADIKDLVNVDLPEEARTVEQTLNEILRNSFLSLRQIDHTILIEKSAQTFYQIKGRVIGMNALSIDFATITIRELNTDKVIKSVITDTSGRFDFKTLKNGSYVIDISAIGMDSLSVSLLLAEKKVIELGDIVLAAIPNNLKEVKIIRKKAYIEQRIDRTLINVGALISNDGANTLEVLQKSPGVSVDMNGQISLKGRSGVLVLIDDKPTYLSDENLATYLKSLPSSSLDHIELMSSPPAKYDAEGAAGIINIKTKKSRKRGFNGAASLNVGQAIYAQKSANANINYQTNKINLFANGGYNAQKTFRRLELERNYFNASGNLSTIFRQTTYFTPVIRTPNLKAGLDYFINPRTTMGILFTGSLTHIKDQNPGASSIYNSTKVLDSIINSDNSGLIKLNNAAININFSHDFDTLGRVITFDADYVKYNSEKDQIFINNTFRGNGSFISTDKTNNHLPSTINIYTAKTDYEHPLKGKAKLQVGLKTSYVSTDNTADYFDIINNVSTINYNLTNRFLYKENINSAYLNFNKEFKRFSLQTGLRIENTNIKGHQVGTAERPDSLFNQHYTKLFPTAYLSYKLDSAGNNQLNFSYGIRIGRPNYQSLNPFIRLVDKFTYFSGNPLLKPQYSYNYDLSYSYKGKAGISFFYNYTKDIQKDILKQNNNVFITTVGNIGEENYFGLYAYLTLNPTSWWDSNIYGELMNTGYKGLINTIYVDQNKTYFNISVNNQFRLFGTWSAELSGMYLSGRLRAGQVLARSIWNIDAGVQKKVIKNKGMIRLSARDIFHTFLQDGEYINIPNTTVAYSNYMDTQVITLGFTYNFGSMNKKQRKRDTGGAQSEKDRLRN